MKGTSKKTIVISWVAVVAWACLIFAASAHTGDNLNNAEDLLGIIKKWLDGVLAQWNIPGMQESSSLGHFTEYTIFGILLTNAFRHHLPFPQAILAAIACASFYGVTDEIHQIFVPGRACDPADWVVDTLGATLGSGLFFAGLKRFRKK